MPERPIVDTHITQHTLWQALTGTMPPPALPPRPVTPAVLDSRDVVPGALFVALPGQQTDGHNFIAQAIANGAHAIICEERGREQIQNANVLVVECAGRRGPRPVHTDELGAPAREPGVAYVVEDSVAALQAVGVFQRLHRTRPQLRVIAITGSVGKTSTKELVASVLSQRYVTHRSLGNLNNEQGLPLALLGLGLEHERSILEMGTYAPGEIRHLCTLARPHIGVVTNVGPSHLERLGSIERIAQAKAELVEALPQAQEGGVAVLNWDDAWVRGMAEQTEARIFRYGLTPEADLWADAIESAGLEGIRFRFHQRREDGKEHTLYVKVPLLGRHSVHTALRAAAVGLVEGLTWQEIAAGLQRTTGQLRLVVTPGINGSTVIDDTYNASPSSTLAALNLLDDLGNGGPRRRIAVLGDMRELGSYTEEGHKQVGIRAAAVTDVLVTVGALGRLIGVEAVASGLAPEALHARESAEDAVETLRQLIRPDDLILVKGSRAVGMDRIVAEITLDEATLVLEKEA